MLPKFLTEEIAKLAITTVLGIMEKSPISALLKRQACHIVILVPEMEMKDDEYLNHIIRPHVLHEHSFNRNQWSRSYDGIAQCKALQLWDGRNEDSGTDIMPHLLFPGDTPNWGGVKRHDIVVACSGVQPWFDQMLSGMVADMCKALAYNAWQVSKEKRADQNFLS